SPTICLRALLSYAAVAMHHGPCEKLRRNRKLATSSEEKRTTPRRGVHAPPGSAMAPPALLLIFYVTPIGGILPYKKGLEGRLNLLLKYGTLLIHLHGLERLPSTDGKAAVGIMDILGEPAAPQAWP